MMITQTLLIHQACAVYGTTCQLSALSDISETIMGDILCNPVSYFLAVHFLPWFMTHNQLAGISTSPVSFPLTKGFIQVSAFFS
jgi:hypothetical protein